MLREELKDFLADKADDMKAEEIVILNVEGKSSVTDYMIICTGTSKRHVSSIADH
ncbi:RsfS/YbeB/iojap family protein, partial [Vibrio parahaemolyticus]|nr:RsfS/YbeB/iojap family protein [Vibrio parahaemolyticus]